MANAVDDLAGELGSIASFLERVAATPSFEPGEMLEIAGADPDLELTEQIGAGGVGVVYLARDRKLDREVAVKVQRVSGNEVADERLLAEARSLARLAHPNVVTVFEVRRVDGHLLVLMELVRGPTLREWLGADDRERDEILGAFAAAGAGLAAAHRAGVVHRDFKPDNVIAGEDGRVRVVDFGMAGAAGESERGGTPAYMAPEQAAGQPVGARADQYAFCLSLLEALTGAQPAPDRMAALVDEVRPAGLRRVLARGLEREPRDRWPDMDALLAALRPPRRWPIAVAAAAALLTGALVVGSRSCDAPLGLVIDRLVAERVAAIERFEEAREHLATGHSLRALEAMAQAYGQIDSPTLELALGSAMHGAGAFIRDVDVEVDGVVDGVELRGDGRRLAIESNGVVRLLDTAGDRVLLEAPGERAMFVDGGRYLAAMTGFDEMSLWSSDTGAAHRTLAIGRVSELATGGDVIFAMVQGGIRAYSTRDGALLFERRADGEPLGGLSVSADGARLLVARSFLTIYDRGGEIIRRASSPRLDTIATIAPDGRRFAMSSNRGLAVVGVDGGEVERVIRIAGVKQIFWSSTGDRIFATESRQVCVWRLAATSARVEGCWQGATGTRHVLPPSLERIAASRGSGAVELWDAGGRVRAVLPVARDGFARVDLSDAGDRVVTASSSGAVRLWRGDADNLHGAVDRPPGHELRYEGGRLAVAGDRELTIWDLDRPDRPLQRFESAGDGGNRVAISAGGSVAAWSGKTWDLDAGRAIAELASWTPGDSVAVSADGAHVITCGRGFCRGFDARGGRERWALELAGPLKMSDLPAVAITAGVSFAPTGEALLTGMGVDAIVDTASGAVRRTIDRETRSLAVSEAFLEDRRVAIADGRRIYIAAIDGEGVETRAGVGLGLTAHPDGRRLLVPLASGALLVDTRSGDQVRIDISSEPTGGAAISPDGALVAIARGLGSIEIFDTATGRVLTRRAAGQFINLVHFTPEGRLVAVTSNGALVWSLPEETRPPDEVRAAVAPLLE